MNLAAIKHNELGRYNNQKYTLNNRRKGGKISDFDRYLWRSG